MNNQFSIQLSLDEKYPVLHMNGDITGSAETPIRESFEKIPGDQQSFVVFNFKETEYINSAGIAILISLITQTQDHKGKIVFCDLNPHFRKVMDIVGLTDFVQVYENLEEALKQ